MKKLVSTLLLVGILCCSCRNTADTEVETLNSVEADKSVSISSTESELQDSEPSFELDHGYCMLEDGTREAFIDTYMEPGASKMDPTYSYYDEDGNLQMELYYDFTENHGCGIRYYYVKEYGEMKGFVLEAPVSGPFRKADADTIRTIDSIVEQDNWIQVSDCDEVYKYDEAERLQSYEVCGVAYSDEVGELYDGEPCWLTTTEFEYWENNSVKKKAYSRNWVIWGQIGQSYTQYFDQEERLIYDIGYASPGFYENYYIYEDNSDIPVYSIGCDETQMIILPEIYVYSQE